MGFLNQYTKDFILGDLRVFREFDMQNFVMNAKMNLTDSIVLFSDNMNYKMYEETLVKSINSLNDIKVDQQKLAGFLERLSMSNMKSFNLTVRYPDYDVFGIKPQYLIQLADNIGILIDKTLKGEKTKSDIDKFVSEEVNIKVKKQMVNSSLPYYMKPKQFLELDSKKDRVTLDVTGEFIQNKIVPFVKEFDMIKKDLTKSTNEVLIAIRRASNMMDAYIKASNNIKNTENVDVALARKMNYVVYNTTRTLLDAISFLSYMTMRKINIVNERILAASEIYSYVTEKQPSVALESENTIIPSTVIPTDSNSLAEDLIHGNTDAYDVLAKSIYEFNKGIIVNDVGSPMDTLDKTNDGVIDTVIDNHEYDNTQYEEIIKIFIQISNGLDIIAANSDDYLMVFDDLLEKSGFQLSLEDRFRGALEGIDDISLYTSAMNVTVQGAETKGIRCKMLKEVSEYPENMSKIAKTILDVKTKLDAIKTRFDANVNGEFDNSQVFSEIKIFLDGLVEQYNSIVNVIAVKLMHRLKSISITLEEIDKRSEDMDDEPVIESVDFSMDVDAFLEVCDDFEKMTDSLFEKYTLEYAIMRKESEGVKVVMEADGDQNANNGAQQTNTTPTAQAGNNNGQNNGKPNLSPTVQDGDKGNGSTGTGKVTADNKQGILDKIESMFTNFLNMVNDFINKTGKSHEEFFKQNKQALLDRGYNNVQINTLPYEEGMPVETILTETSKFVSNIKAMNVQKMTTINSAEDMQKALLGMIPIVSGGDPVETQILNHYKVGKMKLELITIKNGELKSWVPKAIAYCEGFYGGNKDNVMKQLTAAKDVLKANLDSYMSESELDIMLGELFTEADESQTNTQQTNTQNNNTPNNGEKKDAGNNEKVNWIKDCIRIYSGNVINAMRQRDTDYMKILKGLVPAQKKVDKNQNQQPAQEQQNTEQSGNNQ